MKEKQAQKEQLAVRVAVAAAVRQPIISAPNLMTTTLADIARLAAHTTRLAAMEAPDDQPRAQLAAGILGWRGKDTEGAGKRLARAGTGSWRQLGRCLRYR